MCNARDLYELGYSQDWLPTYYMILPGDSWCVKRIQLLQREKNV